MEGYKLKMLTDISVKTLFFIYQLAIIRQYVLGVYHDQELNFNTIAYYEMWKKLPKSLKKRISILIKKKKKKKKKNFFKFGIFVLV